jgi:hypothetical protein
VAAAQAGGDPAEHPDALDARGPPVARLARVIEYTVPDRAGNGRPDPDPQVFTWSNQTATLRVLGGCVTTLPVAA